MHTIAWTKKDPDIHVIDGWMPATKTHPACIIQEDGMWLPQWLDTPPPPKKNKTNKQKKNTNQPSNQPSNQPTKQPTKQASKQASRQASKHQKKKTKKTNKPKQTNNGHICRNLTQNGEPQRYSWGRQKKKTNTPEHEPGQAIRQWLASCTVAWRTFGVLPRQHHGGDWSFHLFV